MKLSAILPMFVLAAPACRSARSPAPVPGAEPAAALAITAMLVEMPSAEADGILSASPAGTPLAPGFAGELEARVRGRADCEVVSHPRLIVRSGFRASISSTSKNEYVRDYGVDASGHPAPIRDFIEDGVWIEATPRILAGGSSIDIDLVVKRSRLERPIREQTVTLPGTGEKATVQLPVCESEQARSRAILAPGQCLLFGMGSTASSPARSRTVLAVVTVDLERDGPPFAAGGSSSGPLPRLAAP